MNWRALEEREANGKHIRAYARQGHKVLEVDRTKVTYRGRKWADLSSHDKRKFENNLYIEHMGQQRVPIKVLYV